MLSNECNVQVTNTRQVFVRLLDLPNFLKSQAVAEPPRRYRLEYKVRNGGARRDRTADLLLAKQALSQLSYSPTEEP